MIVIKFGGTSVATADAIRGTASIVRSRLAHSPVVVVSALAGVTTELLALADRAADGDLLGALAGLERLRSRHLAEADAASADIVPHAAALPQAPTIDRTTPLALTIDVLCEETARLLEAVSVLGHLTPRALDAIASTGELLSVELVVAAYTAAGLPAIGVDARHVVITDSRFTRAEPIPTAIESAAAEHVIPLVAAGRVPVMAGFVGATDEGITTTLGRGGSDYSAALLGAAVNATAIEIWTDVDGMLTADPRVVRGAQPIECIRFDEASELATFGAKVLHPNTIAPAVARAIPVFISNTRRPDATGTRIAFDAPRRPLTAIAGKAPVTLLKIRSPSMLLASGFLRRVFEAFERHHVSVDVVATSEVSLSLTVDRQGGRGQDDEAIDALVGDLRPLGEVSIERSRGVVALVGAGLTDDSRTMAVALTALQGTAIHMLSLSATGINLTAVIDAGEVGPAMRRLHDAFFPQSAGGESHLLPNAGEPLAGRVTPLAASAA